MPQIVLGLILLVQIFTFLNRGGGPLLSYLALAGAVFAAILAAAVFRKKLVFRLRAPTAFYLLFLLFFIISLFFSAAPGFGLSELLLFFCSGVLIFLLAGMRIPEKTLLWFQIILISFAVGDVLIGYFIYTQTPFPRFVGTFIDLKDPLASFGNDFANWLLLILPLNFALLLQKHSRFTTAPLLVFSMSILLSGFLLGFSRAAWMSFFMILLIFAVWFFIQKRRKIFYPQIADGRRILLRCAAVAVITIALVNGLQYARSQQFETISIFKKAAFDADEGAASASERLEFWRGALEVIKDRPAFGGGVYSFKFLFPERQKTFGINWGQPHNIFLKIGVENGVFAMLFFFAFIAGTAVVLLKFFWRAPWHPVFWFALAALASFGHNLIDYNYVASNFTLFMTFIGLGLSFAGNSRTQGERELSNKAVLAALLIFGFGLMFLAVHEGYFNIPFKKGRSQLENKSYAQAVVLLERARNLYFERDLKNYLAAAYEELYQETKDPRWRQKEETLLTNAITAGADADLFSRLGFLREEKGAFGMAEDLYLKSIAMDPQNRVKYYYQLARIFRLQGKSLPEEQRINLDRILNEYKIALKSNRHFTVATDNPYYASALYRELGRDKEAEEFDGIWFAELVKMSGRYGSLKKSLIN